MIKDFVGSRSAEEIRRYYELAMGDELVEWENAISSRMITGHCSLEAAFPELLSRIDTYTEASEHQPPTPL